MNESYLLALWAYENISSTSNTKEKTLLENNETAVYPDVGRPRVEGENQTWARDLGTARLKKSTRVSLRRDVEKGSLVTKGVSNLRPTKPNVHSPLKTVLKTTRKYTERQQDIHQPQISVL